MQMKVSNRAQLFGETEFHHSYVEQFFTRLYLPCGRTPDYQVNTKKKKKKMQMKDSLI